jgi:hypothetical protein
MDCKTKGISGMGNFGDNENCFGVYISNTGSFSDWKLEVTAAVTGSYKSGIRF